MANVVILTPAGDSSNHRINTEQPVAQVITELREHASDGDFVMMPDASGKNGRWYQLRKKGLKPFTRRLTRRMKELCA